MHQNKKKFTLKTSPAVNPLFPLLGIVPGILLLLIFYVAPAILNLYISMTDYRGDWSIAKFVRFKNYIDAFTLVGPEVLDAFWTTIKFALITVLPMQILALSAALLINGVKFASKFFRALFFLPNILGAVVVCFAWRLILDTEWGSLIQIYKFFGISSGFLGDPKSALYYVGLISIWGAFGFHMTIYLAGLKGISKDFYEASDIDGASKWQQFWAITLPLLKPSIVICLWICISGALGMVDVIVLTTGGNYGTMTIGFYIFKMIFYGFNSQGLNAAILFYNFIFVSVVMLIFNAIARRKEEVA